MTRVRNRWNGVAHDLDIDENGRVVRPPFVVSDGRDRKTFGGDMESAKHHAVMTPAEQAAHNRLGSPPVAEVGPGYPNASDRDPANATPPASAAAGDIPPRYVFVPGNWSNVRH